MQQKGVTTMNQLYKIDVEELAFSLGIAFEEGMLPPPMPGDSAPGGPNGPGGPGGMPAGGPPIGNKPPKKFQIWDGDILQKTLDAIAEMNIGDQDILLEGQVPSWVIAAIADRYPGQKVYNYVYYLEKEVEMPRLRQGELDPEGAMTFHVIEQDDTVFLQYTADEPGSHDHSYDYTKLPNVKVPVIDPGKHIYIAGHGATFVQVAVALAYTDTAKSVFLAFHGGDGTPGTHGSYNCAVTHCDEVKIGQLLDTIIPNG